jgi:hypothetical protein
MKSPFHIGIVISAIMGYSMARADCNPLPVPVQQYLSLHPSWSLATNSDLLADDRAIWEHSFPGRCPGFAKAILDREERPTFGLSLFKRHENLVEERLVVLKFESNKYVETTLARTKVGVYNGVAQIKVVWTAPPAKVPDLNAGRDRVISTTSFVYETLESTATTYYFKQCKWHSVLTAN